jgi:septum site-determining protein MinD
VYDFLHVADGKAKLGQALIRHKQIENLYVLATSQTAEKNALTTDGVDRVMQQLRAEFDYVVCDSPAGIEQGAMAALYHADHAIVVCNPEVSSIRDADRILGFVGSKSKRSEEGREPVREHLLVTRYDEERVRCGEMLPVSEIQEILSAELLGIVPESRTVLKSSNAGMPASIDSETDAGQAYRGAVARFLGETSDPIRLPGSKPAANHSQRGFLLRLFRRG